ncbi:molybdopterin (MPT) converting factor, subunit 2 [Bacillus cereus]|uniref:Molybdopterin synthase catalytic subunit n=1 Tax=Bacillus cereus TaxID=1396 RepID=A0A9X6Z950_BACCE|nr:molybdenum cofactor biosynthesis protein MoaE [Bacillus cereus]HDR6315882.1 molybdenum cofactor biosynthesis protein MoaE [Bacillus thuringiensis]PFB31610.1 molybdopterin (MPT) converting factor, subunit 2 [Bacillus cereus]PFC11529.1 molybdopterin (MPT) converting factor, subunit 2 [Bacillus cereus]PFD22071.1 molybdopterin (MPT) converting factor, subunit 2 [Bacillus cereus]PFL61149.1 molybdopterin (MPT) converting factor, subunit 2 [Bacillus cereus]
MTHTYYEVIDTPISIEEVTNKVIRRECGAVATFIGTVREFTKGSRTLYLEYVAYKSMAEKQLKRIGTEVGEKWPGTNVAITHRIGTLQISDLAVVVAVSTPHRKAAYEANEYIMERIKQIVPIWKKEFWEDGESWIGDQLEKTAYGNGEPRKEMRI